MMKRSLLYTLFIGSVLLGASGCSEWLDVNESPNDAVQDRVSGDLLLTSVQNDMDYDRIAYTNIHYLAEHATKSGDYSGTYVFLTGNVSPQNFDDYWARRYSRIANLKSIESKAVEAGDTGYDGIAKILQVIEFRELVDMFGDIPFSEAAQGQDYLSPKYDDAATVYHSLIDLAEEAIGLLGATADNAQYTKGQLTSADIYFHGDFKKWKEYAAAVELSLLMRISNVTDVSAQLKALTTKVDFTNFIQGNVTGNPGYYKGHISYTKMNPKYYLYGYTYLDKEYSGHRSSVPTEEVVSLLRETNHPLLRVFADPRKNLGNGDDGRANYDRFDLEDERYVGVPFGVMSPTKTAYACKFGLGVTSMTCDLSTGPSQDIIVMQGSLVGFYLAEAAHRGLIDGGDLVAKHYYEAAVTSLFNTYETALRSDASTWNSIAVPAGARPAIGTTAEEAAADYLSQNNKQVNWDLMDEEEKSVAIQTQKWLSLYMVDPFEAWSEVRRTDLPVLHASNSAQFGNKIMARFMYPNTEKNLNPDHYIGNIDVFEDLLFWDVKNPELKKSTPFL